MATGFCFFVSGSVLLENVCLRNGEFTSDQFCWKTFVGEMAGLQVLRPETFDPSCFVLSSVETLGGLLKPMTGTALLVPVEVGVFMWQRDFLISA